MGVIRKQEPFRSGYNAILDLHSSTGEVGLNFGIVRLEANQCFEHRSSHESAWVLLRGEVEFARPQSCVAKRSSLFDEEPFVLHCAKDTQVRLTARTDCELALLETENDTVFDTRIFMPGQMLDSEHRGKGMLDDSAYRIVRTVFDTRNAPHSNLVIGEVVNFPGRWSSYPPHHHAQPEIYHYRFDDARGYGHGEVGDDVYKVRDCDTLVITGEKDHAQVAAPGYAMYYLWVIRQSKEQPYTKPIFAKEHAWLLEQNS